MTGDRFPPLRLLLRLQAEFDRLFREAMRLTAGARADGERWEPAADVVESAASLRVLLEVPGMGPEELAVEVRGDRLVVSGDKRAEVATDDDPRFQCVERRRGSFRREIRLSGTLDTHRGRATLADGLLTVEFPKIDDRRQTPLRLEVVETAARSRPVAAEGEA